MNPQEYIRSQLEKLKQSTLTGVTMSNEKMVDVIYSTVMSKKFRKFSVPEASKLRIRSEIEERIRASEPILFYFPFGGYKLWRLEEAPEADWGELFSVMYYSHWLKPICDAYAPGVRFVFRLDEVVVKKMNNIPESDTETYRESFEKVLEFVKLFAPPNMAFEIFLERSRYESYEQFEKELAVEIEALRERRKREPHPLSEAERRSIELNVRLMPGQAENPNWREEIDLIHIGYYTLQEKKVHAHKHYSQEGIIAFPVVFDAPNLVAIGTTKTSIAKFWVGVGALKKRGDGFIETVLSPEQLRSAKADWAAITLKGLSGKNFSRIRIVE